MGPVSWSGPVEFAPNWAGVFAVANNARLPLASVRILRSRRAMRALMAAFLPYIAATLIIDALHFHPLGEEHGPLCRHHWTEQPSPLRSGGYECPACNWQRNLPQPSTRAWSPSLSQTTVAPVAQAIVWRASTAEVQPAPFRGPPESV